MTKKTYQLETLACPGCAMKIEKAVKKTEGVTEGEVLFNSSKVKVTYDENVVTSEQIKEKIQKLGYSVTGEK